MRMMTIHFKKPQLAAPVVPAENTQSVDGCSQARSIAHYLCPVMARADPASMIGKTIARWCLNHSHALGFDVGLALAKSTKGGARRYTLADGEALSEARWEKLHTRIKQLAAGSERSRLIRNANMISAMLGLDAMDSAIFTIAASAEGDSDFERLVEMIIKTRALDTSGVLAVMTGYERSAVHDRLCRGALGDLALVDGFVERPGSYDLYVPWRVMEGVHAPSGTHSDLEKFLLGVPGATQLEWSDYNHIRRGRDFAAKLLTGALARRERGVNILLYGAPGVGKTELAKTIASHVGCDIFCVAQDNDNALDQDQRLAALRVADRLASRRGNAVLLFDEMEDILAGGRADRNRRGRSKVHLNNLLESNATPILWTTNEVEDFDPAFLRRMRFAIELKVPPYGVRVKQWRRLADRENLSLPPAMISDLARDHKIAPSFAHTALKAVRDAGARHDDLDFVVGSLARACYGAPSMVRRGQGAGYDLALVNSTCDLERVKEKLRAKNAPRDVSFCLYGPPGTGKSGFGMHMAEIMGLEPLEKRGSDLLSKWVGQSEKLIAEAFEEAASDNRVLIIDEVESLLWSRAGANTSWEVSMVNEFLIALERCPVPVMCTTNHLERVDPAALRRFTFKVKLDYLRTDQLALTFNRFFDQDAPESLLRCQTLTPGDFAVVKKQLRFCDGGATPMVIAKMLEAEALVKQKGGGRIGF